MPDPTFICGKCNQKLPYDTKNFGGYSVANGKSLCVKHWNEYMEIKNRQDKELSDWWGK